MIGCCGFVSCAPVVSGLQLFSVFCLNMAALPLRLTPSPKLPALQVWSATKPSVKKLHAPSFPVVLTPAQRSSATARLNTPKRFMIFPIPPDPLGARRYLPPEQTLHRHGRCAKRFLSWRANGAYVGG